MVLLSNVPKQGKIMKLKSDLYFMIINVLTESACSTGALEDGTEDDFGYYICMDDIKPVKLGDWNTSVSEQDLQTVIDNFNKMANIDDIPKIVESDLTELEVLQNFYPVPDDYFSEPLELEKEVYLGKRDFRILGFKYDGEVLENMYFEPDFDLFYKEGDEFKRVEFY